MKLTMQAKKAFVEGVLSNEVEAPNFAEQVEEVWVKLTVVVMPVSVAAIYKNDATRQWVSSTKVMAARRSLADIAKTGKTDSAVLALHFKTLADIEEKRARHQVTIDNIRAAIETAADSVTTVEGLKKLLPQYAKYLPGGKTRPTASAAQQALQGLDATIKTANIIAATSKAPVKRRSRAKAAKRTI